MPTPPSPPYLSHVANDDRHDDAIDGHSLTEDDAGSGSGGLGGGEEKELRKKPTFLPEESPATSPPLTSTPTGGWSGAAHQAGQTHRQLPMQLVLTTLQGSYTYLTRFFVLILGAFTPPPIMEEPVI